MLKVLIVWFLLSCLSAPVIGNIIAAGMGSEAERSDAR